MKVGMIGLGKLGEGISRRLISSGHEVHGYRNNYKKAEEQFENSYVNGCTTSIENLVYVIHQNKTTGKTPGVFQIATPKESISGVIDELLKFCTEGDIIVNYSNCDAKDNTLWSEYLQKLGIQYIDAGVVGGVSGLEHGYGLVVTGRKYAVDTCRTIFDAIAPGFKVSSTKNDCVMYPQDYGWIHRNW
jgi:6-phosphogluconate dehydrogenase